MPARRLVRMHAEGAPDVRVAMAEGEDVLGLIQARGRHQEAADAALARRVERLLALGGGETMQGTVRIGPPGPGLWSGPRAAAGVAGVRGVGGRPGTGRTPPA